jgi:hypothetical protein
MTCPFCGRENDAADRFCGGCGASLASAGAASEARKVVTVFFTDVTESTALGEQLDPELLRRVMWRYFEVVQGVLERQGGTVEKFIGDAMMAVFGVPVVHEDDALRAVRAAAELGDALRGLNDHLDREHGIRIATPHLRQYGRGDRGRRNARPEARDGGRRERRSPARAGCVARRGAARREDVRGGRGTTSRCGP